LIRTKYHLLHRNQSRRVVMTFLNEQLLYENQNLQDEIERLTAALVEIRDYPEGEDGRLDSMEAIARAALKEESDE
jgi:hypothetical protein